VSICPLAANPYPFTTPGECTDFLCAAGCATVCDNLYGTIALTAPCDAAFGAVCPPYCQDTGQSCTDETQCCDYDGFCIDGKCASCATAGQACPEPGGGCCSGLSCTSGVCG
jgi:hypothetical protein